MYYISEIINEHGKKLNSMMLDSDIFTGSIIILNSDSDENFVIKMDECWCFLYQNNNLVYSKSTLKGVLDYFLKNFESLVGYCSYYIACLGFYEIQLLKLISNITIEDDDTNSLAYYVDSRCHLFLADTTGHPRNILGKLLAVGLNILNFGYDSEIYSFKDDTITVNIVFRQIIQRKLLLKIKDVNKLKVFLTKYSLMG